MKKKYYGYKLRVINDDGEKYIKLNGNIKMTSYATMVKYYHMTKDKYQDEDCTVEMIGVYEDGSTGSVIFSKKFKKEVEEDKELLMSVDHIVDEIQYLLDTLMRKKDYHNNMMCALNKKQDLLLHKIESINSFKGSETEKVNEKLKIVDELEEVRKERRFNKNEKLKLKIVNDRIDVDVLKTHFSKIKIPSQPENYEYISGELEDKIVREIKYNSDKQKENVIKSIQGKYEKIVDDVPRKTLICYNKNYYKNNK